MPQVEILVDIFGSDGLPHTFIKLYDNNGNVTEYGLRSENGKLIDNGHIDINVDHECNSSSGKLDITNEQYLNLQNKINESILNPPDYNLFTGKTCSSWALEMLNSSGIIPSILAPSPWFKTIIDTLMFNPYLQFVGFEINDFVSSNFNSASSYVRRCDPLTLDLDGDGIETRALVDLSSGSSTTSPVYFDYDGNGSKANTAWISPDDGMLALDRNGNGTIDDGSELFSNFTPLNNGGTAYNGIYALKQEDTNYDGVVNNLDANWNNLKIWRDLNSDGISQSGELFTLEELGITGLNTNATSGKYTFTKTDGATGNMADVHSDVDTFRQQFTTAISVLPEVEALPDMQGSGLVRNLHEAASESPALADLLTQYSQATTRNEQLALMDQLLLAWADTSGLIATLEERNTTGVSLWNAMSFAA